MRGGRLEVFSGQGLDGGRRDRKERRREQAVAIYAAAALDEGLSDLLHAVIITPPALSVISLQIETASLEETKPEVAPTLCLWARFTPYVLICCHAHSYSLFLQQQLIKRTA